jgi:hypothetical protein
MTAAAADVAAGGLPSTDQAAKPEGRRFELRLPFGCNGPDSGRSDSSGTGWRYDEDNDALRIRIEPVVWSGQDWWPGAASTDVEAIEGFWIDRPWTSNEACPATASTAQVTAPAEQTVALGQTFTAESARSGKRNGQPYEAVIPVPKEQLDTSKGFHILIKGRLAGASRKPIQCRSGLTADKPPVCLINVSLDEVAVQNAATGQTLATWDPPRGSTTGRS